MKIIIIEFSNVGMSGKGRKPNHAFGKQWVLTLSIKLYQVKRETKENIKET